jgi:hypothetical protein
MICVSICVLIVDVPVYVCMLQSRQNVSARGLTEANFGAALGSSLHQPLKDKRTPFSQFLHVPWPNLLVCSCVNHPDASMGQGLDKNVLRVWYRQLQRRVGRHGCLSQLSSQLLVNPNPAATDLDATLFTSPTQAVNAQSHLSVSLFATGDQVDVSDLSDAIRFCLCGALDRPQMCVPPAMPWPRHRMPFAGELTIVRSRINMPFQLWLTCHKLVWKIIARRLRACVQRRKDSVAAQSSVSAFPAARRASVLLMHIQISSSSNQKTQLMQLQQQVLQKRDIIHRISLTDHLNQKLSPDLAQAAMSLPGIASTIASELKRGGSREQQVYSMCDFSPPLARRLADPATPVDDKLRSEIVTAFAHLLRITGGSASFKLVANKKTLQAQDRRANTLKRRGMTLFWFCR